MLPWTSLEMEFCKTRDYKPAIGDPSNRHVEKAKEEFRARFMCEDGKDSGVPGVLVATNVSENWDLKERIDAKFYLNANRDLFILQVPSTAHARAHIKVSSACDNWVNGNMGRLIAAEDARRTIIGPAQEEPDVALRPMLPWDANDTPRPRVMIEVEYKNRGPVDARRQGFAFLTASHYHRAYVHIKIYPKNAGGQFAAIAIVWRKPPVPPAAVAPPPGIAAASTRVPPAVWPAPPPGPPPAALLAAAGPFSLHSMYL